MLQDDDKEQGNELVVNKKYLRENAENFSLAPKGQEENIEYGKCNYYTDRTDTPQYVVQTYTVGTFESALKKMVVEAGDNISESRGLGVSVHYIIDYDGTIYQLVPDSKKPWAVGVGDLKTGSILNPVIANDMHNNMNNYCLSIMSVNDGKSPFTPEQSEANLTLTRHLVNTYNRLLSKLDYGIKKW